MCGPKGLKVLRSSTSLSGALIPFPSKWLRFRGTSTLARRGAAPHRATPKTDPRVWRGQPPSAG
ncbi:hypothetical protein GCM10027589_15320 [Actinocorallia lasiicapitis]